MRSQNLRLLSHLKQRPITAMQALQGLGIFRLASRISDLKKQGYQIDKEMVPVVNCYGEETRIAKYYLVN